MPVAHRNQNVRKGLPSKRSPCPVAFSLDIFGDRWTLLVIRDLFYGRTRFKEFAGSPEGIPTNILTDRLERLLARGSLNKSPPKMAPSAWLIALLKRESAWPGIEGDARLGTHVG